MEEIKQKEINNKEGNKIQAILLYSYSIFLIAVILGAFLDPLIDKKIFSNTIFQWIGFSMLIIGSGIIYWAQKTSSDSKKTLNKKDSNLYFLFGPYKYLRSPTHFGLFIITFGFSLMMNSFFGIILNILAGLITRFFFIKKEEELLVLKYGQIYNDYKKRVKDWI